MERCLLINEIDASQKEKTGGGVVGSAFFDCVKQIFGDSNVDCLAIETQSFSRWRWMKGLVNCNVLSLTYKREKEILQLIIEKQYDVVILGTSNIGGLAKRIRKNNSNCRIGIFFHNAEYKYYRELARVEGKLKLPLSFFAYFNEKIGLKYADFFFVLNNRDAQYIHDLYHPKILPTVLPICLHDRFREMEYNYGNRSRCEAIFVGSDFFPNREGMDWFVTNVMPYVDIDLYIIGSGMEKYREKWTRNNVKVLGTVEDLGEYYYRADFVVEPIFSGAGMKTKTAEALMYGKIIFGTEEAFEGYEMVYGENAELCMNAQDYIHAINKWQKLGKFKRLNLLSREMFLNNYSFASMISTVRKVIIGD